MTKLPLASRVLCLAFAIGCGSDTPEEEIDSARTVDASSQTIRAAVKSNVSVASKLSEAFSDRDGNFFYSPISIEAVSGILYAGAAGETAAQLGALLDAEDDPDAMHEGLGALLADLSRARSTYTLSLANRLWAIEGLESSEAFEEITRDDYNAPTESADFAGAPDDVRRNINEWVAQQTKDKIPELFKEGQITQDTVMAAVNAIYFKADWAKAFSESATDAYPFQRADGTEVSVDMMTRAESKVRMSNEETAVWIELPYKGEDISFLAYTHPSLWGMPSPVKSVKELHGSLQGADLDEVVADLEAREVEVRLPRFSLRSRIDLIPVFESIGVRDLFDPDRADLSNIDADRDLYVNPFIHEAMVQVDEKGTVAAAATGSGIGEVSAKPSIVFDRPFLFFIRDNLTGAILFSGQVADPSRED